MPDRHLLALGPAAAPTWVADAVMEGGGSIVEPAEACGLVWVDPREAASLDAILRDQPQLEWVQLPWAGIEVFVDVVRAHPERTWTSGKGVYAEPVAEHALALALAGMRHLHAYARATSWGRGVGVNLLGGRVVVVGGGGITASLLRLLAPFGAEVTVVRRDPQPLDGAALVVGLDRLDDVLAGADLLVLAVALTPETDQLIDRRRLELLARHAWVVNVARGRHIVTDDLVDVLGEGRIGGAALDVTDPEPLPDDHPLWREPRCLITPHTANTPEMAVPLLGERVRENVRRWIAREPLLGLVDVAAGY